MGQAPRSSQPYITKRGRGKGKGTCTFECWTCSQEGCFSSLKGAIDTQMTKESNTTGHPKCSALEFTESEITQHDSVSAVVFTTGPGAFYSSLWNGNHLGTTFLWRSGCHFMLLWLKFLAQFPEEVGRTRTHYDLWMSIRTEIQLFIARKPQSSV